MLSNRIQLIDMLTVLCGRVGVLLLKQLYETIAIPWIKVSVTNNNIVIIVTI